MTLMVCMGVLEEQMDNYHRSMEGRMEARMDSMSIEKNMALVMEQFQFIMDRWEESQRECKKRGQKKFLH